MDDFSVRLDGVDLVTVTDNDFKSIEHTPLNQHYKSVLRLCELLLKDSALDEEIGEKILYLIETSQTHIIPSNAMIY